MTEKSSSLHQLPQGWVWTKLGQICDLVNGRAFKPSEWSSKGVPIIRIQNLNNIEAKFNCCDFEVEEKYVINNGQLLFAWSGTPETSFGAHIWRRGKAFLNQHIFKVDIDENCINKLFFMHLMNYNVAEYIRKAHGTAGLAHITKGKFEESLVSLPPYREQGRIAAKVEELFTNLDVGVESLLKVKKQLKRYRQAVLKYAFEGKLTEKWRKTHEHEIEPAQALLERINIEKGMGAKKTYRDMPEMDATIAMNELPRTWVWTSLGGVGDVTAGGTPSTEDPENFGGEIPWITPADLTNYEEKFIRKGKRNLTEKGLNSSSAVLLPQGTVLFSSRAPIGYAVIAANPISTNQGFKNLVCHRGVFNEYVFWYLKASKKLAESFGSGTTFREVSASRFAKIPIPLAPSVEQPRVVEEIENRLHLANGAEKIATKVLEQVERLRQSILKEAFEGKLVPQDLGDEPVEKLLERIEKERREHKTKNNTKIRSEGKGTQEQVELSDYVE